MLIGWGLGIVAALISLTVRYVAYLRRLGDLESPPPEWQQEWHELLAANGVGRAVPLCVSTGIGPALCLLPSGYALLVPRTMWSKLTTKQRRAILGHELAHYRRGDLWKSLLARAIALPHWFNPLAWYAVRKLDECAEWACDDAAAASGGARSYAETLLQLSAGPGAVASVAVRGGRLHGRIRRLLSKRRAEDSIVKKFALVASILVLTLAGLVRPELTDKVLASPPQGDGSPASAARLDLYGDPLPAGAIARLGTTRFRVPGMEAGGKVSAVTFAEYPKSIVTFKQVNSGGCEFLWWDATNGRVFQRIWVADGSAAFMERFGQPVMMPSAAITPDGRFAVTAHQIAHKRGEWTTRLTWWDLSTGRLAGFIDMGTTTPDRYERFQRIAIAPDGSKAVSAVLPKDGTELKIWERTAPRPTAAIQVPRLNGQSGMIKDVAFAPDGKSVVYVTQEGDVCVWDTSSPTKVRPILAKTAKFFPEKVAISRNGKTMAVGGLDGNVCLLELATAKVLQTLRCPETVESIAFSPDDKQLAVNIIGGTDYVAVWDVASGKVLHRLRPKFFPKAWRFPLTTDSWPWEAPC